MRPRKAQVFSGGPPEKPGAPWIARKRKSRLFHVDLLTDESLKVQAVVVIGRDGQVLAAKITRSSGNNALDKSAENALKNVHQVPRPPGLMTEDRLEYTITFNVKTKQSP